MTVLKKNNRSLGVVMDTPPNLYPKKDTTIGILNVAQQRGWDIFYFDYDSIVLYNQQAIATAQRLSINLENSKWYELGEKHTLPIASQTAVLMRKDPPVNNEYLYVCRILEFVQREGCPVFNHPTGIISANEKIMAQEFSEFSVPTIISRQADQLFKFVKRYEDVVIKPLNEMGGASVFRLKNDDESENIIKEMCQSNTRNVMVQQLIPEYYKGDKRVLIIDGAPVPYALNRIPPEGQLRANLAEGGHGEVIAINQQDRKICKRIAPRLKELGLLFVGIDIIGDKLTEINVTSPTCAREISEVSDHDVCAELFSAIENRL